MSELQSIIAIGVTTVPLPYYVLSVSTIVSYIKHKAISLL